jgi:calcium-dependent protein kinase
MEKGDLKVNKDSFILMTKDSLTDYYKIIRIIGEGGFGKVYEVQNKETSQFYACKKVSKVNVIDLEKFRNEISIMSKADHPNIVKLYEIYESNRSLYLIMELCRGGELFKRITHRALKKNMYTEKDAAEIIQQIVSAVEYCHNNGICHRDLKPENVLYLNDDDESNNPLKIIDFGLSKHFKISKLSSRVGSVHYVSPEVLAHSYTEKCDIWSCGVLLYLLLSGSLPFHGQEESEIFAKIKSFNYKMDNDLWKNISEEAKDLIRHMLVKEEDRYSAKEVLAHPWFNIVNNYKDKNLNIDSTIFKKYAEEKALKKIVLYFIATRLNEKEINELNELFKKFDKNMDGQISYEEFENSFMDYQTQNNIYTQNDIKNIFNAVDFNKNGMIDYSEFIAVCLIGRKEIIERRLLDAFSSFDKNQTGKIKKEDFIKAMHIDISLKDKICDKDIEDLTQDNMVDYNEFLKRMNK